MDDVDHVLGRRIVPDNKVKKKFNKRFPGGYNLINLNRILLLNIEIKTCDTICEYHQTLL